MKKIFITAAVVLGVFTLTTSQSAYAQTSVNKTAQVKKEDRIHPFKVSIPDSKIADLKARIRNTKWPDRELVKDETQGVELATMKSLADYWSTKYDWKKIEQKLNSYPQFTTNIDGVDIHFIHVRSKHKKRCQ